MHPMMTAVVLAAASGAVASQPTAILQDSGFGVNSFADGSLQFDRFDRPVKSGDGSRWILLARNTSGSASDAMYITGAGTAYNLAALEGTDTFGDPEGRTFSTSDRYVDINRNGDWVGTGNLTGGSTGDDEVVYAGNFDGSSLFIPVREGDVIGTGDTLGTGNYAPGITDAGAISFGYSSAASSSDVNFFTNNGTTAALRNGQALAGLGAGEAFSSAGFGGRNAFQTTSDGSSYVARGTVNTSSGDQILVKDGAVVLREGDVFAGRAIDSILGEQNILEDNGDWLTRVRFADGGGGAIKNGTLIAQDGDLVGGSVAGEAWAAGVWTSSSASVFAMVAGDSSGNVVLGGFTDNADTSRNFVWTYNGTEFLRSGDQLDLDGDGTLDDAFIFTSSFTTASPAYLGGFLADDGYFYSLVGWTNGANTLTGDAFIRVLVPTPGVASVIALAGLAGARRRR